MIMLYRMSGLGAIHKSRPSEQNGSSNKRAEEGIAVMRMTCALLLSSSPANSAKITSCRWDEWGERGLGEMGSKTSDFTDISCRHGHKAQNSQA